MNFYFGFVAFLLALSLVAVEGYTLAKAAKSDEIKFGSFNIQVFGHTKMAKEGIPDILSNILLRYDVCFIMEIRDIHHTAVQQLLALMNKKAPHKRYDVVVSERLGRTLSKEQYAYIYDTKVVSVIDQKVLYDERFERPPYLALFQTIHGHRFSTLGTHVKPLDAVNELNAMSEVAKNVIRRRSLYENQNLLLMGDYNADCEYLSHRAYDKLKMRRDPSFDWAFPRHYDTTVAISDCGYDQFILLKAPKCGSSDVSFSNPKAFRFDEYYKLSPEEAKLVSDHYPIELTLKSQSCAKKQLSAMTPLNQEGPVMLLEFLKSFLPKTILGVSIFRD